MATRAWRPWIVGGAVAALGYAALRARAARAAALPPGPPPAGTPPTATPLPGPSPADLGSGLGLVGQPAAPLVAAGPPDREPGSAFAARILNLTGTARERAIEAAVAAGDVPPLLRSWAPVPTAIPGHAATFYVAPDYLGVGADADWLRAPMYPATAQRLADRLGAVLPTRKMVDLIYRAAPVKLGFVAYDPARQHLPGRASTALYLRHQRDIEARRAGRAGLAAGHKKDIVVGTLLARYPRSVQIYGGYWADGSRVQPPSGGAHDGAYVDYSHGVRLVAPRMVVDGQPKAVAEVLADPALAGLLSDEGVVRGAALRYPT